MKEKFIKGADATNAAINSNFPVFARWGDTLVQLFSAKYENRDGEDHLFGYTDAGVEHCLGGAVIECHHPDGIKFVWSFNGNEDT
jgi:hypothetical protein